MAFIQPTGAQLKALGEFKGRGPVTMVNLLKFKPDGGRESYKKYSAATMPFLEKIGAKVVYMGRYWTPVIGDGDWDEVLLVQYPSVEAFFEMTSDPEYLEGAKHRTAALVDSRLWATGK